ncbi:hypothetical protein B0J15DRAFT_57591 [Fusarium solani]|uniref:Uncharacterized protein n=2 Tax=Fusarium solani TaxID=169388 RepID=A0A9P9H428_FUSSL|nr:uncharacterized protein B0J15DRAFT_57591 [Fusarium solani]KAH7249472.1 hypothetical protein B0J15DRAFT_57591 [Fusarium solani]
MPFTVAYLPFTKPIFDQVRAEFRVHGSIARVINRNIGCKFMDLPFHYGQDSRDITTVYNCRTSGVFPRDMALSVSFSPKNLITYAVVYGCDEKAMEFLTAQLAGTDHPVFHPMLLPTLLADIERDRQVHLLRKDSSKTGQLTMDLVLNKGLFIPKSSEFSSQLDEEEEEEPIDVWQGMGYLQNEFQNWQQQMRRMVIHLERSLNTTVPGSAHYDSEIQKNFEKLAVPGVRIQKRLEELIDEYDEHVRNLTTVVEGLKIAKQEIAQSSLEISMRAQKDGSLMKSIAYLIMIFLPATFTSTFFSMDFFDWSKDAGSIVTGSI